MVLLFKDDVNVGGDDKDGSMDGCGTERLKLGGALETDDDMVLLVKDDVDDDGDNDGSIDRSK
jgi:hypothetical protein